MNQGFMEGYPFSNSKRVLTHGASLICVGGLSPQTAGTARPTCGQGASCRADCARRIIQIAKRN